jgi:CheY-like chemotaxis protein/DNA-binding XRE family transcriptional regulator
MDVKRPFGISVRTWRSRLGISQEELADRAGLHRTYICDVERGARNVTLQSIEKLAQALEISVATLLTYARESQARETTAGEFVPEALVDILYVEDNESDVALARRGLKNITNRIHVLRDGQAALNFLFGTGEYAPPKTVSRPHLILLDLNLPKIDGLEVLRRIKADTRTATIPVIVLTSSSRDRDLQTSKHLGAEAYIVKPVDLKNLTEVTPQLKLQWALLRSAAAASQAQPAKNPAQSKPPPS